MYFKSFVTMMQSIIKIAKVGITVFKLYKPHFFILCVYTVMPYYLHSKQISYCKRRKLISHTLKTCQTKWISPTGNMHLAGQAVFFLC
jgi:hypothetical protein